MESWYGAVETYTVRLSRCCSISWQDPQYCNNQVSALLMTGLDRLSIATREFHGYEICLQSWINKISCARECIEHVRVRVGGIIEIDAQSILDEWGVKILLKV